MKKDYEIPMTRVVNYLIESSIMSNNPVEGGLEGTDDNEFNF